MNRRDFTKSAMMAPFVALLRGRPDAFTAPARTARVPVPMAEDRGIGSRIDGGTWVITSINDAPVWGEKHRRACLESASSRGSCFCFENDLVTGAYTDPRPGDVFNHDPSTNWFVLIGRDYADGMMTPI